MVVKVEIGVGVTFWDPVDVKFLSVAGYAGFTWPKLSQQISVQT